tara:strand:- start:213 stop:386 length:174 start_codon:yes stop_codon:yes gene_type:complete
LDEVFSTKRAQKKSVKEEEDKEDKEDKERRSRAKAAKAFRFSFSLSFLDDDDASLEF